MRTLISSSLIASALLLSQPNSLFSGPEIHEKGAISRQASQNFTQAAKKAIPAVVSIKSTLSDKKAHTRDEYPDDQMDPLQDEFWRRFFGIPQGPQKQERRPPAVAQGSGFVISEDGYILTNNHVVQGADNVTVTFNDGTEFPAKIVGCDANTDIGLLKIDAKQVPFLALGNSDELDIGEWVIAVGNPLGLQASITVGVVSAKGRNDLDIVPIEEFIQTDAAINRGNSGGPLLNLDGEVIGMNTAIASSTGGYMGIGFAIPSNLIKHITEEIMKNGKVIRGFLGVTLQKIDPDLAQAFTLNKVEGALVTDIIKDGPADKAGIKPGDIILKVNNQSISNVGSLRNFISLMHPAETVTLLLRRNDKEMTITATVGTHPESEAAQSVVQGGIGIVVQELSQEAAAQLGYSNDKGVLIKYVDENSIAWTAGIRSGQLILSVNRKPVSTPEEFYKVIQENKTKQLLLHIKAGQNVRFISLKID